MVQGVDGIHKKLAWLPDGDCADRAYEINSIIARARRNPIIPIDWLESDLAALSTGSTDDAEKLSAAASLATFVACFDSQLYLVEVPEDPEELRDSLQQQIERKFGIDV
ncbi:TPA: hypothetical protein EYO12_00925 [Candidatus Saccharibacteria bacterium]|nr:hypothetical protein [Candidatus Saccharibacteria bacterium]HIO87281.1 hypothetical protein [Candidatus Saccharibacteria bacterium]